MAHPGLAAIAVLLAIIVAAVATTGQPPASSELAVLAMVKAGLDPSGALLASWNASAPCGTWVGLVCDRYGHVISMSFDPSLIFRGTLGDAIGSFPYLTELVVRTDGLVRGTVIPVSIGKLQLLQKLVLSGYTRTAVLRAGVTYFGDPFVVAAGVGLVGSLPAGIAALPNLKYLDLSNNTLGGLLPSFAGAKKLVYLDFSGNKEFGGIPYYGVGFGLIADYYPYPSYPNSSGFIGILPTFGAVNSLSHMNLANNYFESYASLAVLKNLTYLNLAGNSVASLGVFNASYITSTSLTYLNISNNRFEGPLPDLSHLKSLQNLDLSMNPGVNGTLRDDYGVLRNLLVLNLLGVGDSLQGPIPESYGKLINLVELSVMCPNFSGTVDEAFPSSLGNLDNLTSLNINAGNLVAGLPSFIGKLPRLQKLVACGFSGSEAMGAFPANLVNLQNLTSLSLGRNLTVSVGGSPTHDGNLPQFILSLKALQKLELTYTKFSGPVWPNLGSLQSLSYIDLSGNYYISGNLSDVLSANDIWEAVIIHSPSLVGPLPTDIGRLKRLRQLVLSEGFVEGVLPASLSQLTALEILTLKDNRFEGTVPDLSATSLRFLNLNGNPSLNGSIQRLPKTLQIIDLRYNNFNFIPDVFQGLDELLYIELLQAGSIPSLPPSLFSLPKLQRISASLINLASIPSNVGKLQELVQLDLGSNSISQPLPSGFQLLKNLIYLILDGGNAFTGSMPDLSGTPIFQVYVEDNQLTGSLPKLGSNKGLGGLTSEFAFGNNGFSGTVPRDYLFGKVLLAIVVLSYNQLSGPLPALPPDLPFPQSDFLYIDFSHNNFSGTLPRDYFNHPLLENADVSYNQLSGPVPNIYDYANVPPPAAYGGPYPGVLDYNYFTGRPVIDDGTPTGYCIGPTLPFGDPFQPAPTSFNCFSYDGTDCADTNVTEQRSEGECTAFCGDLSPEGPCAGHGFCSFQGYTPVCTCNLGYSPAATNEGIPTCVASG